MISAENLGARLLADTFAVGEKKCHSLSQIVNQAGQQLKLDLSAQESQMVMNCLDDGIGEDSPWVKVDLMAAKLFSTYATEKKFIWVDSSYIDSEGCAWASSERTLAIPLEHIEEMQAYVVFRQMVTSHYHTLSSPQETKFKACVRGLGKQQMLTVECFEEWVDRLSGIFGWDISKGGADL